MAKETLKIHSKGGFTTIYNLTIRDNNLSNKSLGLLVKLLSLPENWNFSFNGIVAICKDGKSAVSTEMEELKASGYLYIDKVRDKDGTYLYNYNVYDTPQEELIRAYKEKKSLKNKDSNPDTDFPVLDNPELENQVTYKENNIKEEVIKDTYKDENTTPIGIYNLQGNTLTKLTKINRTPVVEQDLGVFQIYPSNEDTINLSKAFGPAFYDEWSKYQNIKLGFNLKFTLSDGRNISYNIFSPENTFDQWEYLMNYLYDDFNNYGKNFYSHIEKEEFNENTLMTSIKLQSSYSIDQVNSKITLTVFTYDTEDDFKDNEYRGNSKYSMDICLEGRPC